MLNGISWQQFIIAVIGIVCLYYLIMIGLFLKGKVTKGRPQDPAGNDLQKRRFWQLKEQDEASALETAPPGVEKAALSKEDHALEEDAQEDSAEQKAFDELTALAQAIEGIMVSENEGLARKQLMEKVAFELRRFPQLNKPPYKIAIANLIRRKAQLVCNLTLTEEDVEQMWE
jgi:hypothetical protein